VSGLVLTHGVIGQEGLTPSWQAQLDEDPAFYTKTVNTLTHGVIGNPKGLKPSGHAQLDEDPASYIRKVFMN
jgi:hypothetical protein